MQIARSRHSAVEYGISRKTAVELWFHLPRQQLRRYFTSIGVGKVEADGNLVKWIGMQFSLALVTTLIAMSRNSGPSRAINKLGLCVIMTGTNPSYTEISPDQHNQRHINYNNGHLGVNRRFFRLEWARVKRPMMLQRQGNALHRLYLMFSRTLHRCGSRFLWTRE